MTIRSILLLVLLICAGFLGNYFTLPLFFGADFLFGSIAVLLVLYFYGLGWGMLAAVIAYSYTWFLWGHPYGFLNFTSEALFIGLFLKRGNRNLLVIDGVFWLLLGMPLVALEHGVLLHMDVTSTVFIMFKQSINGIFNTLLASLAICFLPLANIFQQPPQTREISMQTTLFNLLVMMMLLPTLLLIMLEAREEKQQLEDGIVVELQSVSTNLQFHLQAWFHQHLEAVQELARLAEASSMTPAAQLQHETETLKRAFSGYKTMHVENELGRTIAFAPRVNDKGESTLGHDLSDRYWFQESKAKKVPVVSALIHGRISVFAPLIVIAAPVMRGHQWLGTAAGSLDLQRVQEMLKSYSREKTMVITLTDSASETIASTAPDRSPMQAGNLQKAEVSQLPKTTVYHWYPDDKRLPSMTRWKQSFYIHEVSLAPDLPWKLTIKAPVAPLQKTLYTIYVKNLTVVAILIALILFLSLVLSRWLTKPLAQLSQVTTELPQKLFETKVIAWPKTSALEINSLITNAKSMVNALEENFYNIQIQRDELLQFNLALNQEIQERQRAEDDLRESEERFRTLFETMAEGVALHEMVFNEDGKAMDYLILAVNPAFEKHIGLKAEQISGKLSSEAYGMGAAPYLEDYTNVVQSGRPHAFEAFFLPLKRHFNISVTSPRFKQFFTVFEDITERKLMEDALRDSEARLVEAQRVAHVGSWELDIRTHDLWWSDETYRIFGFEKGEFGPTMEVFFECVHPDDRSQVNEVTHAAWYDRKPFNIEHRIILPVGEERFVHELAEVIYDDAGQPVRMIGTVQDITQRKQMEEALVESEEKYRVLFEKSLHGILIADIETERLVYANPSICRMLGYSNTELLQLSIADIHPQNSLDHVMNAFESGLSGEKQIASMLPCHRKDGSVFYADITIVPQVILRRRCAVGFFMDATERTLAEMKIKASLAEKEVLLREIYHRVKNNMQVISSLLNLQSRTIKDQEALDSLVESQKRIDAMALVHEKLYRSKDLGRINFAAYIQDLVQTLLFAVKKNTVRIKPEVKVEEVSLGIDTAIPLGLIINELISNCLKHAFPASAPCGQPMAPECEIRVELYQDADGTYTLIVSDNGVGLSKDLDYRTPKTLGLDLVNTLVEQLDGTVAFESSLGTQVKITFTDMKHRSRGEDDGIN